MAAIDPIKPSRTNALQAGGTHVWFMGCKANSLTQFGHQPGCAEYSLTDSVGEFLAKPDSRQGDAKRDAESGLRMRLRRKLKTI